jgi:hypothetical protein
MLTFKLELVTLTFTVPLTTTVSEEFVTFTFRELFVIFAFNVTLEELMFTLIVELWLAIFTLIVTLLATATLRLPLVSVGLVIAIFNVVDCPLIMIGTATPLETPAMFMLSWEFVTFTLKELFVTLTLRLEFVTLTFNVVA